ncbi:MAG: NAD(P)H-dependent glycerol-3-phosphate dehydrogenase [Pseudomonadota bacterium]
MSDALERLTVVGSGSWGTALAIQAQRAGRAVRLLARTEDEARRIRETRDTKHLPGVRLDGAIEVASLEAPGELGDAVLCVVPSDATVAVATHLAPGLREGTALVICAKGLHPEGPKLLGEALGEAVPGARLAVLSGPSFADEVAQDLPTAVALAVGPGDRLLGEAVCRALHSQHFRPYLNDDPIGVQIGGATKNIVAIACGMARGLGFGANAEAALLTRGLAEIARLGRALGARPETLLGLAGVGDLALTCAGPHSRNFRFGEAVGRGVEPDRAEREGGLAEGRKAVPLLLQLAGARGVDMPIAATLEGVLGGRLALGEAIEQLLERPLASEFPGAR